MIDATAAPARSPLAALALALVVVGTWIAVTGTLAYRGELDLGFTTSNALWLMAGLWQWPTALLVLGATALRSRPLVIAGLAAALLESVAFVAILVVQLALGAAPRFVADSVPALLGMLAAAVAASLALLAGRDRGRRGLWIAAFAVAALVALAQVADEARSVAFGLGLGLDFDALTLLAAAIITLPVAALAVAVGLLALESRGARWTAAVLVAIAGLLALVQSISSLLGSDLGPGVVAQLARGLDGLLLVGAGVLLARSTRSTARRERVSGGMRQPEAPRPPQWAQAAPQRPAPKQPGSQQHGSQQPWAQPQPRGDAQPPPRQ